MTLGYFQRDDMGTLRDEAYEKLDYLSQLTEVVIGPQNEVLGRVPDRVELKLEDINSTKHALWGMQTLGFELNVVHVLRSILPSGDQDYVPDIVDHFELQTSKDFELDLANCTMIGSITLVKVSPHIDEKKILELAIRKSCQQISYYNWPGKRVKDKIVTVLNTFEPGRGTEWAKNLVGRAAWDGEVKIKSTLSEMILENKWRIRDVSIILKVGKWINSYLMDEDDSDLGLVNLTKLKMMLDKDLPVYSVDEVKNVHF